MKHAHIALLLSSALALGGCSRREPSDDCGDRARVVDQVLLAFLSKARSAHHLADQREVEGDLAAALKALESLTQGAMPPGRAPEVDEVLADTRARMADLFSQLGRFDQADEALSQGLERSQTSSYFRGHLFEVRGLVEERRQKALRAQGRGPEADQARQRSLSAYEEAMKIQAEVIGASTPSGSAVPRP